MITSADIEFISKKTGLNKAKTILLCEEESDLNLVLNEISAGVTKEELSKLSFSTAVKLAVFSKSLSFAYDFKDKVYVANAVIHHYPDILFKKQFRSIPKKGLTSENQAQYFITLYGLNRHKLKGSIFSQKNVKLLAEIFFGYNQRGIYHNLSNWIQILTAVQTEKLLHKVCFGKNKSVVSGVENFKTDRLNSPKPAH